MADRKRRAVIRPLDDRRIGLYVGFENKDDAYALPSARWDKDLVCWVVDKRFLAEAEAVVARLNGGYHARLVDALISVFRLIPEPLREMSYEGLGRVWQRDSGGGSELLRALDSAWNAVRE